MGIGGAIGSVGSTLFTAAVGILWTRHALLIFFGAGLAYLAAMAIFQRSSFTASVQEPAPEQASAG